MNRTARPYSHKTPYTIKGGFVMLGALKSWWSKKDKGGRKFIIFLVIFTAAMLIYAIIHGVVANADATSPFAEGIRLNRPMIGGFDDVFPRILGTLFYFCLLMSIAFILRGLLFVLFIKASNKVSTVVKLISSTIKYACALAFLFITLSVWGVDTYAILVSAGIIALIIGLGAQSLISDIIAGINIVFEGEYHVGDVVLIDNFRGTVLEIGLTTTKLVDVANHIKVINNSKIATVVNLSASQTLVAVEVGIDYGEDLEKVENIIKENIDEMSKHSPLFKNPIKYAGVSAVADSSVNLKFFVDCDENDRFAAERALNREIYLLFNKYNITIPFPQVTISQRDK